MVAYRHDGSGMGGGPLPEKTVGWLWGFICGAMALAIVLSVLTLFGTISFHI